MSASLQKASAAFDAFAGEVDAIRKTIAPLRSRLEEIARTPVALEDAISRLDAQIATWQRRGLEHISVAPLMTEQGGEIHLPDTVRSARLFCEFLLACAGDHLREALKGKLLSYYSANGPALSLEARQAERAKIESQLLDLELAEEALIRAAERVGIRIARREDADLRAIAADDDVLDHCRRAVCRR